MKNSLCRSVGGAAQLIPTAASLVLLFYRLLLVSLKHRLLVEEVVCMR
mgnify:FL=1